MRIIKDLVYAIIPARSGSTSIKDKNIRMLGNHPLVAYSVAAANCVKEISRTIVSTDSDYYRSIVISYGAEAPFLRPSDISTSSSTDLEFMLHAINWFNENDGYLPEYWVHLRPTTPFRDPSLIKNAIECIKKDDSATCLRSVHVTDLCPMKWFIKNDEGYLESFCNLSNEDVNNPRQSFPDVFIPNGYVDVLKTNHIINTKKLHGDRIISFEVPPSIDIDYEAEFQQLQNDVGQFMGPIIRWLNEKER